MLYDFHQWQNGLEAGKVHATYIICGTRKSATQPDGDVDMIMSSAPESESWGDEVQNQTIALVTEERLKGKLAEPHKKS